MIVYYVEGDKGHLLDETVGMQRLRMAVRGAASSFHMPWRDILDDQQQNIADHDLQQVPRPQECLKYALRVHLRRGHEEAPEAGRCTSACPQDIAVCRRLPSV